MWKLALIGKRKRITKTRIYKILHPLRRNGYREGEGEGCKSTSQWMLEPIPPQSLWAICFLGGSCPRGMEELDSTSSDKGVTGQWSSALPERRRAVWTLLCEVPLLTTSAQEESRLPGLNPEQPSAPEQFHQKVAVLGQNHTVSSQTQQVSACCMQTVDR